MLAGNHNCFRILLKRKAMRCHPYLISQRLQTYSTDVTIESFTQQTLKVKNSNI